MKVYKRILKGLLCANVMFVLIAASCGYQKEQREKEIARTNAALSGQHKDNAKDISKKKVIPVGKTVGIYINTQGSYGCEWEKIKSCKKPFDQRRLYTETEWRNNENKETADSGDHRL